MKEHITPSDGYPFCPACDEEIERKRMSTIQGRFEQFNSDHPEVYNELVRLARQAKTVGRRAGIRMLWERMRWTFFYENAPADDFKLNDHFHSRYARMIMSREPDLAGFFDTRPLRA